MGAMDQRASASVIDEPEADRSAFGSTGAGSPEKKKRNTTASPMKTATHQLPEPPMDLEEGADNQVVASTVSFHAALGACVARLPTGTASPAATALPPAACALSHPPSTLSSFRRWPRTQARWNGWMGAIRRQRIERRARQSGGDSGRRAGVDRVARSNGSRH